ncbi:hypothetical protein DSM3645_02523 [Blastopirellula marina DSM 3645]|uniref:Uncharacterized protein n=1 Tax=Blastopirellula marina DSM 3645 TaxID=314230 RepID=A3ZVG8_9BACT|nr:hypothetical protein DSM3645_02523 [Blastopirellula marina DSM 3645]
MTAVAGERLLERTKLKHDFPFR